MKSNFKKITPFIILMFFLFILFGFIQDKKNENLTQSTNTDSNKNPELNLNKQTINNFISDRWYIYLNSIGLVVITGSTLLSAIVIIKIQSISATLISIEKTISDAFCRRGKLNEYSENALKFFRDEKWNDYFNEVYKLTKKNERIFIPSTQKSLFIDTKEFVESNIIQGKRLRENHEKLLSKIKLLFSISIVFAGITVLALPVAPWISEDIFLIIWIISGLLFIIILSFFFKIIYYTFNI